MAGSAAALFALGAAIGALLLALLWLTLRYPVLRVWPTPGAGSWQSYVFWPLFRSLNVLCFAMAAADPGTYLGLPAWVRLLAFLLLVVSVAIFIYAFKVLGKDNSYGARQGLVTAGIYRWTRNPQNAMLVVVYICLAFAADSARTYVLCAAMVAAYTLMVWTEERWLEAVYGEPYRRYCGRVPRFFNWRRAAVLAKASWRRQRRPIPAGDRSRGSASSLHPTNK
jgi:protein-S-isoprenylcysteine O-methyltransferase Ste14